MATLSQKRVWFSLLGFASMVVLSFFAHWYFLTLDGTKFETAISVIIAFVLFGAFSESVLLYKMRSAFLAILVTVVGAKSGGLCTFFLADTGSVLNLYAVIGTGVGCAIASFVRKANHPFGDIGEMFIISTLIMTLWALCSAGISVIFTDAHMKIGWAAFFGFIAGNIYFLAFQDYYFSRSSFRFWIWLGATLPAAGIAYAMSQDLFYPATACIALALNAITSHKLN